MKSPGTSVPAVDGSGMRVGIVAARFNEEISRQLVSGATAALLEAGVSDDDLTTVWVAGAFEIPVVLAKMASGGPFDALVALGCVVRGDTPHFDYVAGECARGCSRVALDHQIAVGFGVLTTDTWEQALERAGGLMGNKGEDAAMAALETAQVLTRL